MDARDRLRRYLEQRRDMGETELILDGMSVEDVMRIVGAGAGSAAATPSAPPAAAPRAERATPAAPTPREQEPDGREAPAGPEGGADWREVLRATGSAPASRSATPIAREGPSARREAPRPPTDEPPPPDEPPEDAVVERNSPAVRTPRPTPAVPATPVASPPSAVPVPPVGDPASGIVVGAPSRELFGGTLSSIETLDQLADVVEKCTRCPLYKTATKAVPGQGSPTAELVCVGEAPGENEDKTGQAFVGAAGQLLTKILAAINLSREDVFICNVLKHRPPGNRNPSPQEVEACSPYLVRQLEIIRPKVIVAFGTFAAQTLLNTTLSIGKLRGSVHRYHGIPLVVTYHPAALLRNPAWKRPTWEDVQLARRVLDRTAGA
jgi:uracil-DNA glycosylase